MPIECKLFMNVPLSDIKCPRCGVSSNGFMRGQVQRSRRFLGFLWRRPYCAIICHVCKDIIGHESPPNPSGGGTPIVTGQCAVRGGDGEVIVPMELGSAVYECPKCSPNTMP